MAPELPAPTADLPRLAQAIVETVPQPLVLLDAELRVVFANAASREVLGLDPWSDPDLRRLLERVLPHRAAFYDFALTRRLADGTERRLRISARRLRAAEAEPLILVALEDETELVAAREAARALARVFSMSPDPILLADPDGTIRQANPAASAAYGTDSAPLEGQSLIELAPDHGRAQWRDIVDRCRAGSVVRNASLTRRTADGRELTVLTTASPLRDDSGAVVQLVSMEQDLSELEEIRQALEQRDRLLSELEDKNAELERFTYTVSHDLKSPLITIRGFIGRLRRDLETGRTERSAHRMERIDAAADRMERLLDDLLQLSRVGRIAGPPERVPLDELVAEVRGQLGGLVLDRAGALESEGPLPAVYGDRTRLREVLQNLVENGLKYGSTPPRVTVSARIDGSCVRLEVCDDGPGIPPEYRERVFGLFERLEPDGEGTGIGLALVKRIVEVHGGQVGVASGPAGGALVWCTLPRPPEELP